MSIFKLHRNAGAAHPARYSLTDILSIRAARRAHEQIARCPHYRATPLRELEGVARRAGVAAVFYKDEAERFGIGSFKALGGAYAVACLLAESLSRRLGREVSVAELARGEHAALTREMTVVCATDGNHGRAVAAGARVFHCNCVIFLHAGVSEAREQAIKEFGAKIVRTRGDYDDSVREAARAAELNGWQIVSDTSWPGYETIPSIVMQGYTVMVIEVLDQLRARGHELPTHVFLQGGVGGLAAAVVAHLWEHCGPARVPKFIVVEPQRADCLFQSALAGRPTPASGDLNTVMAGLACGEVSAVAWRILQPAVEYFMTIEDDAAIESMRLLAGGEAASGKGIIAGESAVAGLAALLELADASNASERRAMGLDGESGILLFGTEGATDPVLYEELVGAVPRPSASIR